MILSYKTILKTKVSCNVSTGLFMNRFISACQCKEKKSVHNLYLNVITCLLIFKALPHKQLYFLAQGIPLIQSHGPIPVCNTHFTQSNHFRWMKSSPSQLFSLQYSARIKIGYEHNLFCILIHKGIFLTTKVDCFLKLQKWCKLLTFFSYLQFTMTHGQGWAVTYSYHGIKCQCKLQSEIFLYRVYRGM